jgi:chromosome partitioning protein
VVDEYQAARFARDFEHIVIDTKARPEEEDLRSLADGCDMLVIPTTPDAMSLDALLLTVDALEKVGSERYRILLTIIPPRPSRDGQEARAMLERRGLPVFKTEIHRLVAFQKAALAGVPVYQVSDPRAKQAWEDYKRVGKELLR